MKRPVGYGAPTQGGAKQPRPADPARPPKQSSRVPQEGHDGEKASASSVREARDRTKQAATAERQAQRDLRRATRARKRSEKGEVRRFTGRRRRARITALVFIGLIVTLAGVVALGAFSPLFALRDVEVVGTSRIPSEQVSAVVDGQLGTPLPLLDFASIEEGLAALPLIQTYSTESRPPGTLVVRIVERTPIAVITTQSGFELVDSAGVTLETSSARITGYPIVDLADGDVTSVPFTAAAAVLAALPTDLLVQVDSISARTTDDVTLVLVSGQRVVWGDAADSVAKAQRLARLLEQQPGTVSEYDVSSPGVGILR